MTYKLTIKWNLHYACIKLTKDIAQVKIKNVFKKNKKKIFGC